MWSLRFSTNPSDQSLVRAKKALDALKGRNDLGFFRTHLMRESIEDCLESQGFFKGKKTIVVIGMGGSSLGTQALCQMLKPFHWKDRLVFLDNVDAFTVDHFLESLENPQNLGWVLCSKSGGTIEVTSLFEACENFIKKKHNFSIVENTLAITENKDSSLFNFAKENKCPVLFMPKNVGGRFSVFTSIGLFPLSCLSLSLQDLLEGYELAMANEKDAIQLAARLCELQSDGFHSFYSFQYSDRLFAWGLWLQQLWSESLGKKKTRKGEPAPVNPTFISCRGASDQHSVLQQIMEGTEKKFICFHRVKSSEEGETRVDKPLFESSLMGGRPLGQLLQVEADATENAVRENGIPTIVLSTDELKETTAASLMGLWMLVTGIIGEISDIDAFNQPGVESGKVIARRVLSQPD